MAQVLPRTTPEQRQQFYGDVETLIQTGFLSVTFTINGVTLALRTLGPGDSFMLRARVADNNSYEWKVWTIASSIWMVGGYNLLDESNVSPRMAQMVKGLPVTAQDILFGMTMSMYERLSKALEAVEAYCCENISRYRWKTFGGHFPAAHSGIPGVERLGTNHVQRIWTFYNEVEDLRIQESAQWEGFKLVASSNSPKGVKKIDEHDRTARQSEVDRKQALLDRFYYTQVGVLSAEGESKEAAPIVVGTSKSADELADEMFRWVTGQDDWHDKIVADYKKRITDKFEAEKRERAERAERLRAAQEMESDQPRMLTGYTPAQLEALLQGKYPGKPGVRTVSGGEALVQQNLYERYLKGAPDAGALQVEGGKLAVREGADLTQQVAQRQVPFGVRRTSE